MKTIKAISMWQPWATLWMLDIKKFETRGWNTNHRGVLVIHAAKRKVEFPDDMRAVLTAFCPEMLTYDYPLGMALGTIELTNSILITGSMILQQSICERALGIWKTYRFAWEGRNRVVFPHPIPVRGHQRLWDMSVEEGMIP